MQVPSLSLRPCRKRFTTLRPSSLTRRCCVRLSPIAQYSLLLPPVGVWAVSQSQCGRSPSQAGYPSKPWWAVTLTNKLIGREPILGRKTFHSRRCRRESYPVLAPLSRSYPRAKGRLLTCYSPVRRSSTTEVAFPLDLHVLSTPPAFVLSQDQTLRRDSIVTLKLTEPKLSLESASSCF